MPKAKIIEEFKSTGLNSSYWSKFLIDLAIAGKIPWHRLLDSNLATLN